MVAERCRRYKHSLHHHDRALIRQCLQEMRDCLPSQLEDFVEFIDGITLAAAVSERVLGVSFNPSLYDPQLLASDIVAEMLHAQISPDLTPTASRHGGGGGPRQHDLDVTPDQQAWWHPPDGSHQIRTVCRLPLSSRVYQ